MYKTSKIFVLPSIYEGLGNVLIEALNYSRACIASDCEHGPSEILMNGKNGYIFKSKKCSKSL
jgi:GalNAc-alpha-(1->4)-GalNAc-alpha-(1->3)-diNAcBac-PP-undecaprenol alpha-1,4-N-acetyl-D-galactosaminyltransferase